MCADITMCNDEECKIKESCYRFTAYKNKFLQAYFVETPREDDKCDYYWKNDERTNK